MRMPDAPRPFVVRPFGGVTLLASGVIGGLVLWYAAFPSMYYLAWIAAIGALFVGTVGVSAIHLAIGVGAALALRRADKRVCPSGAGLLLGWVLAVTLAVGLELPLRAHFALARGGLEQQLESYQGGAHRRGWAGAFLIGHITPGRCDAARTLLWVDNDSESALVHAPGGIEGLCYNEGQTGHFGGDWYWLTED